MGENKVLVLNEKITNLIKKAHQEAHECNATLEVHTWIDWFEKELRLK